MLNNMIWIDSVIVCLLLSSIVLSLWRGVVKETISLATWVGASLLSYYYAAQASIILGFIQTEVIRKLLAGSLIFMSTLVCGGMFNFGVGRVIKTSGAVPLDKVMGAVFGLLRGVAVVLALVVVMASSQTITDKLIWQQSILIPRFHELSNKLAIYIPEEWKQIASKFFQDWSI